MVGYKNKNTIFENMRSWARDTYVIAIETRYPQISVCVDGHAVRIADDFIGR